MARAELVVPCASLQAARVLWEAISADDPGTVTVTIEDHRLVLRAGPSPVASLRVTMDDLLACLQAARGAADMGTDEGEVD
jgi:hypothetical protein